MPDRTIRVLLVDDHALFRDALTSLLSEEPDLEVRSSPSLSDAIKALEEAPADIVLLDIDLGDEQGGAFFRYASEQKFQGKVLVVTAGVNSIEAERLLKRGAVGIFLKHDPPQLLLERIRALHAESEDSTMPEANLTVPGDRAGRPSLTLRERQVLRAIFAGLANKEIAAQLGVSEPAIKAVVRQLFSKTAVRTRSQLVRVALEKYWDELEAS